MSHCGRTYGNEINEASKSDRMRQMKYCGRTVSELDKWDVVVGQ